MQLWMAAVILLLTAAGVYFLLSSGRLGKKLKIALVCALAVLFAVAAAYIVLAILLLDSI